MSRILDVGGGGDRPSGIGTISDPSLTVDVSIGDVSIVFVIAALVVMCYVFSRRYRDDLEV